MDDQQYPDAPTWIELETVKPLREVVAITSLSADTIRRCYGAYVVQLARRRCGMKLRHVLAITNGELEPGSRAEQGAASTVAV
jgi:hypothetical protein